MDRPASCAHRVLVLAADSVGARAFAETGQKLTQPRVQVRERHA